MSFHILIIDDDEQMRLLLQRLLVDNGYQVRCAANGHEGTKMVREELPDLIITDILMPEKDGLATIIEVKKEFPQVKMVAISGGGRLEAQGYLDLAQKFGVHKIFTKPFKMNDLLETVSKLVNEQQKTN